MKQPARRLCAPPICAVVLLAATALPAHAQDGAAAPPAGELRRLMLAQLRNADYHLPLLGDKETRIRFRGGRGLITFGPGATERVHARLTGGPAAFGDLDGDQVTDAAVTVAIDPGGSGSFIHLLALLDLAGAPVQAARAFLGDRVRVEHLAIRGGQVLVTMLTHGPGEPACCPATRVRRAFALQGRPPAARSGHPDHSAQPDYQLVERTPQ